MQPTYLPWAGYFNLIASVDVFVFLDDVQFEHQSWQTRNRVIVHGRPHMLVVPVQRAPLATRLADIRVVDDEAWRKKHERTLQSAYGRHAHAAEVLDVVFPILRDTSQDRLAVLNRRLIESFCERLGLETRLCWASDLHCAGSRSEHLLEICAALECGEYLSPVGAGDYLEADGFANNSGISLRFQDFMPVPYAQSGTSEFCSHLSLVDVVANIGWRGAQRYIRG